MVKTPPANTGDAGLDPRVGKIPWRRKWQPTPVFLPGESHVQRRLAATVHRVAKSWTQLKRLSMHKGRCSTSKTNHRRVRQASYSQIRLVIECWLDGKVRVVMTCVINNYMT